MLSIQELRSTSKKELLQELEKARRELLKVRVSLKTKHEKDTSKSKKAKREIAQILTLLKEMEKEPSATPAKASETHVSVPVAKPVAKKPTAKAPKASAKKAPKKNS